MKHYFAVITILILLLSAVAYAGTETVVWQVSDFHYISPRLNDGGPSIVKTMENGDGKMSLYSTEMAAAFIEQALREHPDVIAISGDLTFNGAQASHEDLAAALRPLREAGIRVLVIPGNHDIDYPFAAQFIEKTYQLVESPDLETFTQIWQDYGWNDAVSRAEDSFSYMTAVTDELWILMLDTSSSGNCVLTDSTLSWVRSALQAADAAGARVLAISHQNLKMHSIMFPYGYQIARGDELEEIYAEHYVLLNLSGHLHIQHQMLEGVPEIATTALTVYPNRFAVVTATDAQLNYGVEDLDVSGWAKTHAPDRTELTGFTELSRAFFDKTASRQRENQFSDLPEEEQKLLISVVNACNVAYFSGEPLDLEAMAEGIEAWRRQPVSNFFRTYILSIIDEQQVDHRSLTIQLNGD